MLLHGLGFKFPFIMKQKEHNIKTFPDTVF